MLSRRSFLSAAAAVTCGSSGLSYGLRSAHGAPTPQAKPAGAGKRILIIGGTSFVGPAVVEEAQRRGITVTLFNRGKTNAGLFPEVEKIHGDRNADVAVLQALFKGRTFDSVIDTSGYFPRQIRNMTAALAGVTRHYLFVSSVSVYSDMSKPLSETSALATLTDPTVEKITEGTYGGLKVLCEQAAQTALPAGALIVRPGYIVGPRDPTDRFTSWPLRVRRGGPMMAPGTPQDPIQVIDVRDLAAWMMSMVVAGRTGVFNAVGPKDRLTMGELLDSCKRVTGADARPIWVPAAELTQAKLIDLVPIWVPPAEIGMAQVSHARALAQGMTFRPLATTIKDTLDWWATLPAERQAKVKAGLSAEQEATILRGKVPG